MERTNDLEYALKELRESASKIRLGIEVILTSEQIPSKEARTRVRRAKATIQEESLQYPELLNILEREVRKLENR